MIEGYFRFNYGHGLYCGLYCKVLETNDKYEIWSNLKLSNSYSYNFSNLPSGKRFLGNTIKFQVSYSLWKSILGKSNEWVNERFDFTKDKINIYSIFENIAGTVLGATQHSGDENDFVFLGSVIKK